MFLDSHTHDGTREIGIEVSWIEVMLHKLTIFIIIDSHVLIQTFRSQDVTQPYEYKGQISKPIDDSSKLKVAIVGFGNFGQFLARTIVRQGHSFVVRL